MHVLRSVQAVAYWSKAVRASGGSVESLQAVIEKSVVLGLATNTSAASNSLADLLATYASTLATQVSWGLRYRLLDVSQPFAVCTSPASAPAFCRAHVRDLLYA